MGTESLHGARQADHGVAYLLDLNAGVCVIDISSRIGRAFDGLFAHFLRRDFGPGTFSVKEQV